MILSKAGNCWQKQDIPMETDCHHQIVDHCYLCRDGKFYCRQLEEVGIKCTGGNGTESHYCLK